jgi:hypothetical protein
VDHIDRQRRSNDRPLPQALRLACAAGSLQVTRFGAQELRPSAHPNCTAALAARTSQSKLFQIKP